MRSLFMFAALAAVLSFTGCCSTGGGCHLGKCKLGSCGLGAASQAVPQSSGCGCSSGGCSSGGCSSGVSSAGGCTACGSNQVVSMSAPYSCDGGCGGSAPVSVASPAPSSCGCSSCDGGGAVQYAPAEYSPAPQYAPPVQYAPIEYAPAAPVQSGGCAACGTASAEKPSGLLQRRAAKKGLSSNKGLGLNLRERGKACTDDATSSRRLARQNARSLRSAGSGFASDRGVSAGCDSCSYDGGPAIAQMSGDFLFGSASGGRRISSGIVSDVRQARASRGCGIHGCGGGKLAARRAAGGGCGVPGCGANGKLCDRCTQLAHAAGLAHPYGGGVPHTNPTAGQPPSSGIAPQYAYPYYTTRGPRDFLRDNPPSIGY